MGRGRRSGQESGVPTELPSAATMMSWGSVSAERILQEPGQVRRFVERRDGDLQERGQLRTRAWKRVRRSRVIGPDLPAPISRPSTCRMATTSAAVPVKNASSAV